MTRKKIKCFRSKFWLIIRTKDRILRGKILRLINERLLFYAQLEEKN